MAAAKALPLWLAVAGLGLFHGINPAMGWLFAVALGLHRGRRRAVLLSTLPIALGHAAAVVLGWALWLALRGHRPRPRIGMQSGLAGLALWSFLMALAHGAGVMLVPAVAPLCAGAAFGRLAAGRALPIAAAALGLHTAAMLAAMTVVALAVYEWVGLAVLRSAWINFDLLWIGALAACGGLLLLG